MAVRTDVVVSWELSPRIVCVEAPSVDITIQDLYDTLRDQEDDIHNLDSPAIIKAAGKDVLGGGVLVGITATLLDAQLSFEGRTTSTSNGTHTGATSSTVLIDSTATFLSDGVARGDVVHNHLDQSSTSVLTADSEIQLTCRPLTGGIGDEFESGDPYDVFDVVQCNVAGGNLVAVDDVGADLDPIFTTSYTQVVRTSSSSATLQELDAIQVASYNNGVTIDLLSPNSGTDFPVGTPQQPVNNFADALLIAAENGFVTLFILGDVVVETEDFTGKTFVGQGLNLGSITLNASAILTDCTITKSSVTGTLDGDASINECNIASLTMVSGLLSNSLISGTITLGSESTDARIVNCSSATPGAGPPPIIDCGGAGGSDWLVRGWAGDIQIDNMVDSNGSVDMDSGQITLDSTCTGGTLVLRGLSKLTDNSTGTAVDATGLLKPNALLTIAKFLGLK